MAGRPFTTVSAAGWRYLFVVLFIVGGAVLGEVNLLVIVAGMMVGPLLFNWRFARATMRDLTVVRQLPQRIRAGDPLSVSVTARNDRRRLASWAVAVEDSIERVGGAAHGNATRVRVLLPRVAPGRNGTVRYRVALTQRGRYRFGPWKASTRYPLGLIQASTAEDGQQTMLVCPRLGQLTPRWLHVVNARRLGSQSEGRHHGIHEGDYFGLREWRTGDSQRWIHWRTSAKLGELAVRQFEQQRNRDVLLVLDLWQPDSPTQMERLHTEVAISFLATAVTDLCRRGGSRITVGVCAGETQYWTGPASAALAHELLDQLAEMTPGDGLGIYEVLDHVRQYHRKGLRATIISTRSAPFLTAEEDWETGARPADEGRLFGRLIWIDCRSEQLRQYYCVPEL